MLTLEKDLKDTSELSLRLADLTQDMLHLFTCLEGTYLWKILIIEGKAVEKALNQNLGYCQAYMFNKDKNTPVNIQLSNKIRLLEGKITIVE